MGKVSRLSEAAAQIRAGSRMLVREVKRLVPPEEQADPERLARETSRLAQLLEAGRLAEAEDAIDRVLAPILAGPGHQERRVRARRRRWLVLLLILLLATLGAGAFLLQPVA